MHRPTATFRAVLLAVVAVAAAGCTKKIDMDKVKSAARTIVKDQLGVPLGEITCPDDDVKPKRGTVFECTAKAGGVDFAIEVTLTDAEGTAQLRSKDVVSTKKVADLLTQGIKDQAKIDVTVDCGAKPLLKFTPEEAFECTASDSGGNKRQVAVKIGDAYGNGVTWEAK